MGSTSKIEALLHEMTDEERERFLEEAAELYDQATSEPAPGAKDPAARSARNAHERYRDLAGAGYAPSPPSLDDDD